jgi:hypothetical protein
MLVSGRSKLIETTHKMGAGTGSMQGLGVPPHYWYKFALEEGVDVTVARGEEVYSQASHECRASSPCTSSMLPPHLHMLCRLCRACLAPCHALSGAACSL